VTRGLSRTRAALHRGLRSGWRIRRSSERKKTLLDELREAGLFQIAACAVGLVLLFVFVLWVLLKFCFEVEELGQFGDSFGALTSLLNALAFLAVVATVVLQSRELRESRQELAKQAEAQKAWADAATRQIELTKQLEAVRIRPFIKAEWSAVDGEPYPTRDFWVRNVGLGVALLKGIDLRAGRDGFGTVYNHQDENAQKLWFDCLAGAGAGDNSAHTEFEVVLDRLSDLNRALAPGERQRIARVRFFDKGATERAEAFEGNFRPVVHFHSVGGTTFSTENQFDGMR